MMLKMYNTRACWNEEEVKLQGHVDTWKSSSLSYDENGEERRRCLSLTEYTLFSVLWSVHPLELTFQSTRSAVSSRSRVLVGTVRHYCNVVPSVSWIMDHGAWFVFFSDGCSRTPPNPVPLNPNPTLQPWNKKQPSSTTNNAQCTMRNALDHQSTVPPSSQSIKPENIAIAI